MPWPWPPVCLSAHNGWGWGWGEWVPALIPLCSGCQALRSELEPPAMLPPGQAQHHILGSPRAEQGCPPVPLLPASCARKCTIWAREQVEMGQSRSSGSALGMRDLGSHSPTSSDDRQGQSNAEAPSPQESLLGPAWGQGGPVTEGPGVWGAVRVSWLREKATLFPCFIHRLSQLSVTTY